MLTWAVYLWPRGPSRPIHSDTLFGALCWAWRVLYGREAVERFLSGASEEPPFVVSSAFPAIRNSNGVVRAYPMPIATGRMRAEAAALQEAGATPRELRERLTAEEALRKLRRLPYISESALQAVAAGTDIGDLWSRDEASHRLAEVTRLGMLLSRGELDSLPVRARGCSLCRDVDIPRNHANRLAGATVEGLLFSVPARFYAPGVGLWFALRATDLEPFRPLLRYLADTGIGGKRSVRLGQFDIPLSEIHEVALPGGDPPARFMALSLYAPEADEIVAEDRGSAYRLVPWHPRHESRGAPPGLPVFKGRLLVMEEGSVLVPRVVGREFYGRCHRVPLEIGTARGFQPWHCAATIPLFLAAEKA